ncbi:ABC transporter substrate-binding protein [Lacicoccus qingdaonensis]|uniref:Iron complex transport system substrate-binding protein n=1 Tax=Lacicoccus qingdaonensis TaxID=576118 RepID=A0A1G9G9G2_9BACL|nr:ABC transporter substrate-binding protein [Salinicoccus qingdaonensis]SDK97364.1 iron complex transport system substrate-binding protein [Salinicoccus qingdaonensis]
MNKISAFVLVSIMAIFTASCSSTETDSGSQEDTFTYESELGPVEVPEDPERIVALTNGPNIHALDVDMVGVDQYTKDNPLFSDELEDVATVSETDAESVMAQNPDLIIAGSHMENIEDLEKIAPTVVFTWGEMDYLEQHIEIGKLVGKEDEAEEWAEDFDERAGAIGEEVKEIHGENVSVTTYETADDTFYIYGDDWARGTEILYQAMDLNMPENVEESVSDEGYHAISQETLGEYAGDFIVLSRYSTDEMNFKETDVWQTIPAVQDDRVIEIDLEASTYSDPITLEYLLEIYEEGLTQ